jgi:hypothetical protein
MVRIALKKTLVGCLIAGMLAAGCDVGGDDETGDDTEIEEQGAPLVVQASTQTTTSTTITRYELTKDRIRAFNKAGKVLAELTDTKPHDNGLFKVTVGSDKLTVTYKIDVQSHKYVINGKSNGKSFSLAVGKDGSLIHAAKIWSPSSQSKKIMNAIATDLKSIIEPPSAPAGDVSVQATKYERCRGTSWIFILVGAAALQPEIVAFGAALWAGCAVGSM